MVTFSQVTKLSLAGRSLKPDMSPWSCVEATRSTHRLLVFSAQIYLVDLHIGYAIIMILLSSHAVSSNMYFMPPSLRLEKRNNFKDPCIRLQIYWPTVSYWSTQRLNRPSVGVVLHQLVYAEYMMQKEVKINCYSGTRHPNSMLSEHFSVFIVEFSRQLNMVIWVCA